MVAAGLDRAEVVTLLLAQRRGREPLVGGGRSAILDGAERRRSAPAAAGWRRRRRPRADVPGVTRPFRYNELIGGQGGLTALHFAARKAAPARSRALIDRRRRTSTR